jgi:hypothetical protein
VRRVALVSLLAVAVLTGCGKSERAKRHDAADRYIAQVNAVRVRYGPAFAKANTAYQAYAKGAAGAKTLAGLQAAARSLVAAEAAVRKLQAPPDAGPLRRAIVHLYDLQSALAVEVERTAAYSPKAARALAPLRTASAEFNRRVKANHSGVAQASALDAYAGRLRSVAARLDAVAPPPVLVPWRDGQTGRLRSTAATAARLAQALRARDAVATRALTRRLRAELGRGVGVTTSQQAAVRSFNARLAAIVDASRAVDVKRSALERKLG